MPSITTWSRIEPSPRGSTIADSLAARVRDPLWMLTRQWQLGEFRGEDAGSPALAQVESRLGRLTTWSPPDAEARPVDPAVPLEAQALREPFAAEDLALAVELGQAFEGALLAADRRDLIAHARAAFPLGAEAPPVRDARALRFHAVVAGRCVDGVSLLRAAEAAAPGIPAGLAPSPADEDVVRAAIAELAAWVRDTVGAIGDGDAPTWTPERLEYRLDVAGVRGDGGSQALRAHPTREGGFPWYAFDAAAPGAADPAQAGELLRQSALPVQVGFRGMPRPRWWSFEDGTLSVAAISPDLRELAKLVVLDFALLHGNDWYMLPMRQPVGSLCTIEALLVQDVFGTWTRVRRADRKGWTLFSSADESGGKPADFLLMPPSAWTSAQIGAPLEEVRFARDETANLAWGIERAVADGLGEPWRSDERSSARTPAAEPPTVDGPPRYRLRSAVREHWIPFLPVAVDAARREVRLERGIVLGSAGADVLESQPAGRILRPSSLADAPYRLFEEEVPRVVGATVQRLAFRCRWTDGSTHLWSARRKRAGAGEEESGLRFDELME